MSSVSKLVLFLRRLITSRSFTPQNEINYENNEIRTPRINFTVHPKGLAYYIYKSMRKHSSRIANIDGETERKETFGELRASCKKFASRLIKLYKIDHDHIVCFLSCNHFNLITAYISIILLGAIPASLDANMSLQEIEYLVKELKPKLIITETNIEPMLLRVLNKCQVPADIICFDPVQNISLMNIVQTDADNVIFIPYIVNNLNETAIIVITSGSDTEPKCVCISHFTMLYYATDMCFGSTLSFTSLFQVSSIVNLFSCIVHGQTMYICKTFLADKIWVYLEHFKVAYMYLTPYQCAILFQCMPERKFNHLRRIAIGGYSLAPFCLNEYEERLPKTKIYHVYGLAEIFLPFQVVDEIISIGLQRRLGPLETGELWIKSKTCATKYFNQNTGLNCWDKDGFFNTGDLAYYDNDFNFFIAGSANDMIKTKNNNIIRPIKLEHVIMQHLEVEYCAVVGIRKHNYEDAVAYVTPLQNSKLTVDELIDFVYDKIPVKYHLSEGIILCDYLPINAGFKVNRKELKKWFIKDNSS